MAVRKIEYTVSADGIEPAVKQFAGVQGDHKATELIFNIDTTLYESLTEQLSDGGKLIYRFDGYDGEGGLCRSDTTDLSKTVTYSIEEWLTRFGGIVKVVLVISLLKDDLTEMELFSFPALLQLKNLPEGTETDGESYESMSVLAQVAKDSANTAVESAEVAVEARKKTELARAALENGTVWVFDGGDAEGNVDLDGDGVPDTNTADIKFVIDGEMSDSSENAVMNKIIKAYVDKLVSNTVKSLIKQAKLDAHPVGSYYWSSKPDSPANLFGGTWERVQGKFILAAGTYTDKNGEERTYTVGDNDLGEYSHKLTESEMPSHRHGLEYSTDGQTWKSTIDNMFGRDGEFAGENYLGVSNSVGGFDKWSARIGEKGNSQPHNNMPPYEVAYCWKRTA